MTKSSSRTASPFTQPTTTVTRADAMSSKPPLFPCSTALPPCRLSAPNNPWKTEISRTGNRDPVGVLHVVACAHTCALGRPRVPKNARNPRRDLEGSAPLSPKLSTSLNLTTDHYCVNFRLSARAACRQAFFERLYSLLGARPN